MRYELKMVFPETEYSTIVHRLLNNRRFIREIYHERQINNIYFDTLNYSDYIANLHGDTSRKKYRIRWYGSLSGDIAAPMLEMKYKHGFSGGKKIMQLPRFHFNESFDFFNYADRLRTHLAVCNDQDCAMLGELMQRTPALVNSYIRRYFLTQDEKYRITLDKQLWYASPSAAALQPGIFGIYEYTLVLEVKFDTHEDAGASELINELGYRIDRNSKYVNGILATADR